MSGGARIAGIVALALIAAPVGAASVTPEMFGSLPDVSQAEISPDGKTIAQIQSQGGLRAVAFYDLTGAKAPTGVKLGTVKARALRWGGPDHALALVSDATTVSWGRGLETIEVWRWASINRSTGNVSFLFRGSVRGWYAFGPGKIFSLLPADPLHIVMGQFGSLFRVNLERGSEKRLYPPDRRTVDWVVDSSGEPTVRIDYDSTKEERRFYARKAGGKKFELASALPEKKEDEPALIAYGRAGADNLIHGAMISGDFRSLCVFDVAKGERTRCDIEIPGYDISGGIVDPSTDAVVGALYTDDMPRARYIDAELQDIQANLERAMPNAAPLITSWSDDRQRFIVTAHYADHPPQFFLFDRKAGRIDMVAASYEALDGKVFAAKQKYDYTTSDGLQIRGYLTVPAGANRKSMPLIVMPHGGPEERVDQSFNWWSHFYAARGYLVYEPNFRGSAGYGETFRTAGYREHGRKVQSDISEGVQSLIADGTADPSRICIVGISYGGYAALAGATLTPDLYACAVSVAGVTNIPAQIAYDTDRGDVAEDSWNVRFGSRVDDNAAQRAVSPYYQAHKAHAPILLIHGKDDIIVPIGQSRMMEEALRAANVEVRLVELPGEDHWLSSGETRTQMLAKSIEFIDRHIGAAAGATAN